MAVGRHRLEGVRHPPTGPRSASRRASRSRGLAAGNAGRRSRRAPPEAASAPSSNRRLSAGPGTSAQSNSRVPFPADTGHRASARRSGPARGPVFRSSRPDHERPGPRADPKLRPDGADRAYQADRTLAVIVGQRPIVRARLRGAEEPRAVLVGVSTTGTPQPIDRRSQSCGRSHAAQGRPLRDLHRVTPPRRRGSLHIPRDRSRASNLPLHAFPPEMSTLPSEWICRRMTGPGWSSPACRTPGASGRDRSPPANRAIWPGCADLEPRFVGRAVGDARTPRNPGTARGARRGAAHGAIKTLPPGCA